LPHNILESTFIDVPRYGILSIGGIFKAKDSSLTFNKTVYQFNEDKLTWDPVFEIPEPRINPYLVLSTCGNHIYCIGG
jgi:N-acetylneuraminic acid mutarotase